MAACCTPVSRQRVPGGVDLSVRNGLGRSCWQPSATCMRGSSARRRCASMKTASSVTISPISPQVIGTMSTRTTHPLALRKIVRIFDLLAESLGHSRIALENPYQWLTKSEVIGRLQAAGGERLIAQSVSCTSLQAQSNTHTHCGSCSQCLDRRFAIVALGLEEYDPVHGLPDGRVPWTATRGISPAPWHSTGPGAVSRPLRSRSLSSWPRIRRRS